MKGFTVRILGTVFAVKSFDCPLDDDRMGITDTKAATISVCSSMPPDIKGQVLVHEILETLSVLGGLNIPTKKVEALSRLLWGFIADNPSLFPRLPMGGK